MARFLATIFALLPFAAVAETNLVMFERVGCQYCAQWNEEVGPEYAQTDEGRSAPLVRLDVNADLPADMRLTSRPVYTPTFVLVKDGQEVGRIEGYPGEDFFWPMLGQLLSQTKDSG